MREVDEYERRNKMFKKKTVMSIAAVICILVCLGTAVGAATGYFTFGGIKTPLNLKESILNAGSSESVEEFERRLAVSEEPFAVASRESDSGNKIILDYSESIGYTDVADEDDGYRFELKSVTKASKKHRIMTEGSIADGTAVYEWTVSDSYFAVIEASRCDGEMLTEKDSIDVMWRFLIDGYTPSLTDLHFKGYAIYSYRDDYKLYYAVEITEMMPFAENALALAGFGYVSQGDTVDLNRDTVYADDEGRLTLVNEDDYFGIMLRFELPDKYASDNEKYAEEYFKVSSRQLNGSWIKNYQNDVTE